MELNELSYKVKDKETGEVFEIDEINFKDLFVLKKGESREDIIFKKRELFEKYELMPPIFFKRAVMVGGQVNELDSINFVNETVVLRWGGLGFWAPFDKIDKLIEPYVPDMVELTADEKNKLTTILEDLGFKIFDVDNFGVEIRQRVNLRRDAVLKIGKEMNAEVKVTSRYTLNSTGKKYIPCWYLHISPFKWIKKGMLNEKVYKEDS